MLAQWQDDWGLKAPMIGAQNATVCRWSPGTSDDEWESINGFTAWAFQAPTNPGDMGSRTNTARRARRAVARSLFGEDQSAVTVGTGLPSLAQGAAEAAWADWLARLGALAPAAVDTDAAGNLATNHTWSGHVQATLPWCSGTWSLRLAGGIIAALLSRPTAAPLSPLSRLTDALAPHPMKVQAQLTPIVLTLGQLQALHPGDVIALTHPLDQALRLQLEGGTVFAQGWLGRQNDQMAVQLAATFKAPA